MERKITNSMETIVASTVEKTMSKLLDAEGSPLLKRFKNMDSGITEIGVKTADALAEIRADMISRDKDVKRELRMPSESCRRQ